MVMVLPLIWTGAETQRLAALLDQGIAHLGDPLIPAAGGVRVRHVSAGEQDEEAGVAVDAHSGELVLCLFAPDWLVAKFAGPQLPALADLFIQRVREVHRARRGHVDRFARARRMMDTAIERSAAGMKLLSLKTAPQRVDANLTGCYLKPDAIVGMLDDALQPYEQRITEWTPRELASATRDYIGQQRKRQRAQARLRANGAVIEIDALAERVIASAGANLSKCATALLTSCDPQTGLGQQLLLSECVDSRTSVFLRAGRIMAGVVLTNVGVVSAHKFTVDRAFPEAVTASLPGRSAAVIANHPLLHDLTITSAQNHYGSQTLVRLKVAKRFVKSAELEALPLAA